MSKVDKIEAKQTKSGTGMKRVQEIEAEGKFILNLILLILYPKNRQTITSLALSPYTVVGNKMHKAFPLPGESSHWQYKFLLPVEGVPTARRMEISLPGVCTAMMKKLPVKDKWQLH
nr:hypothetical protein [Tanacetum cinerariifolium]